MVTLVNLLSPFIWRLHRFRNQASFRVYFRDGSRTRRIPYENAETLFDTLQGDASRIAFDPFGNSVLAPPPASILRDRSRGFEDVGKAAEDFITEALPSLVARPDLQRRATDILARLWRVRALQLPMLEQ